MTILLIVLGIQISRTDWAGHANAGRTPSREITTLKPVVPVSLPLNWNQPVNIVASGKHPDFPLTLTSDDEYVLIINNLERTPQQSKTVTLSAEFDTGDRPPAGCYFQNTASVRIPQTAAAQSQSDISPSAAPRIDREPAAASDSESEPAATERSFFLFVTDGSLSDKNQYTRIKGRLIQQSPRVAIYLDDQQQQEELANGLAAEIIEIMEQRVLDQITSQCGPIWDIDDSERFTILLSPWLNKLQGGKTAINGFVRPSDFRETVPEPFSNHCDMLYLNSTLKPGQELLDLLSHEVTHAAISSIRAFQSGSHGGPLPDEEDWLNEGIAHIMEPGFTNRDYRISEFYRSPESYPLVVPDYYRAQLWRNHGCRGAVNLFLGWCNQIEPDHRFPYRFTQHPLTGVKKIEQLTALHFSELFRQWSLHLARQALNGQAWDGNPSGNSASPPPEIQCGKFLLAGPALRTWNLERDHATSLKITSTASSFLHIKLDAPQTRHVRISVNGFRKMQMTLLKIPQNKDRLTLSASAANQSQDSESIEVRLSCLHPAHSKVETISLEYGGATLSRTERQPRKFQTDKLNSSLTLQADTLDLSCSGTQQVNQIQVTEFLVRLPRQTIQKQAGADCLTFKAVVKTDLQTWLATQCDFKLPLQAVHRVAESASQTTAK
mgnify:CR=1 FL=1